MHVRIVLPLLLAALVAAAPASAQGGRRADVPPLAEGGEPYGPEVMVAAEDAVPVRTDPGFVYRELRFLPKGQEVVVDARKGPWYHVRPEGWILADHLVTRDQAVAPPPVENQRLVAAREGVRVRATPSTDAAVTRTLAAGEAVEVTGQDGGWWVLAGGGYVAVALLRAAETADDEAGTRRPAPWVVSAETANVRQDKATTAAVVRTLPRGQVVAVTSVVEGWAEVEGGWVRADLLQPPSPATPATPSRAATGPASSGGSVRRWSLVDLHGTIFQVIDLTGSPVVASIKQEMLETGMLEEDWTYLGLTIGVPEDAPYRFNYAPDRNTTIVVDEDGQKYGNVYARGPIDKLPAHVRQFFLPMQVQQGEKYDGVLLFRPTLKPDRIREVSMFIGGRTQRLYPSE